MKQKTDYHYIMVIVIGCGMIAVTLGLASNLSGLFFNDIAREFSTGRGTVALSVTIYSICSAVMGMIAPNVIRRIGLKKIILAGSAILIASTVAISFSPNIVTMIILNIIRGFGAGLVGMVTVNITINYWFHKNNALMTSIVMSFSGIVGAVLSPVLSNFSAAHGWRNSYLLIAAIMTVMLLPGILFPITLKPEGMKLSPYGESSRTVASLNQTEKKEISRFPLYMMFAYTVMVPCATALSQHYTGISDSYGLASVGAIMVSATMITNTAGKLLYGLLSDRIGPRITTSCYVAAIITALFLLINVHQYNVMLVAAALIGLSYSMGTVASSSMAREVFGAGNYSRIYPKLSFCITITNSVFTTLIGGVYDLTGSYSLILTAMMILEAAALVVIQLIFIRKA